MPTIERIYRELDLGDFEAVRAPLEGYVGGLKGYRTIPLTLSEPLREAGRNPCGYADLLAGDDMWLWTVMACGGPAEQAPALAVTTSVTTPPTGEFPICDIDVDHCLEWSPVNGQRLCSEDLIGEPLNGHFGSRVVQGNQVAWVFDTNDGTQVEVQELGSVPEWLPDLAALGEVRIETTSSGCEYGNPFLVFDATGEVLLLESGLHSDGTWMSVVRTELDPACPSQDTSCFASARNVASTVSMGAEEALLLPGQGFRFAEHTVFLFSSWAADTSEVWCDDFPYAGGSFLLLHNDLLPGDAPCSAQGL